MEGSREAEMICQFALQGITYTVKLAGEASMRIAAMLAAIVNKPNETPGKTRLAAMMNSGEPLDYFSVPEAKLKDFAALSKKYGVQYCLANSVDGEYDLIVKRSNAPMINRIAEQLGIGSIEGSLTQNVTEKEAEQAVQLSAAQKLMQDMLSMNRNERENPGAELAERSPSGSSFVSMEDQRGSIVNQIADYKGEMESARDLFATARNLRESMTSNLPEGMEPVIVDSGWERPMERYNDQGERLYRGKTLDQMNEQDKVQFMVDDAMAKNGSLPEDLIQRLYMSGWKVNENGMAEPHASTLDTREKRMILDMMRNPDKKLEREHAGASMMEEVMKHGN